MYVCLWSPSWSTAGEPGAEAGGRAGGAGGAGAGRSPGRSSDPSPEGDAASPSSYDLAPHLAEHAPRLRVEREVIWADGRGLDAPALAETLIRRLAEEGVPARAGVAAVPVTAELAARWGPQAEDELLKPTPFLVKERTGWGWRAPSNTSNTSNVVPRPSTPGGEGEGSPHPQSPSRGRGGEGVPQSGWSGVVAVEAGREAAWQGPLPVSALRPPDRLKALFDGVGIATMGGLAALEREAVEVRFGGGAVPLWRAARADDRRMLFDRIPPDRPHGSMDFVDYVLTDPSRLLFTANALLGPLCDGLVDRGAHARTLRLELPLANGETWSRTLRPARPTASRETWLRLIRGLLDRLTVPDAVAGMRIEVPSTETASVRQGDLFDRGFATSTTVEAAVARLAERRLWPLVPETDAHPRIERRGGWKRQDLTEAVSAQSPGRGRGGEEGPPSGRGFERRGLTLQLISEPRRIVVETKRRRDHEVPVRLRDRGGWREVAHAAGPDRISGGQWEASSYAREYYRCVTDEGVPLWIYRDAMDGGWYLHGWWD